MKPNRSFYALTAALLFATALYAQTAPGGILAGRVTDNTTKLPLEGARVTIPGTSLEAFTGRDGSYVLLNVPAGARDVVASYVGYPQQTTQVTVEAGQTASANLSFGDATVELEKFVIQGSKVGTARAINQQRAANTLTNVVASDEIGRFPDQNVAEATQRIPGVSLYRDQGEGRFILIRGINYTLGNVTLNGTKIASPETGERGIALDVIPSDALASLEVTKVPTPDMDGEGLGGQVNIKTKSAFDHDGLDASFTAQGQYSPLVDRYSSKFNGAVSNIFGDGKWGVLVAPTWQKRKFGSFNYEIGDGWTPESVGGGAENYFLQDIAFREYVIERERYGVSSAIEFKPDTTSNFYLRTTYNKFVDTETRQVSIIPFVEGTLTALTPDSATVTDMRRFGRRLRDREKDQELFAIVLGGEKRIDHWTFDGNVNFSEGREEKPAETEVRFRRSTRDGSFRYTFSDTYNVNLEQLSGASITDPASYNQFQELTRVDESGKETEAGLGFNARYDFVSSTPTYVKFGGVYREKEKTNAADAWEYGVPASFTFPSVAGAVSADYPYGFKVPVIDPVKFRNAFNNGNAAGFTQSEIFEDSYYDDWKSTEDVFAAYAMGGITFGKTNLISGLRVENTRFRTHGQQLDLDTETAQTISGGKSYTNWLPGIYLRHEATERLVLRAAWSNSIVRPSFGDSAIRRNINREDEELTVGNPDLDALRSVNWDVSAEYYLPSLGLVSAAAFYKDIKNFSYETEVDADPAYPGYEVTSFRNGSKGHINGIELAYQQQLGFLPAPLDGFGLLGNVTISDSAADYPTRPGEDVRFVGQSRYVGNAGLTYEKRGFFARLVVNFRSERLREDEPLGSDSTQDFWIDDTAQLDLSTSYRLSPNWEVYAEFLNLTNEPFRVLQKGGPAPRQSRFVQVEEYDWSANVGVRWKL